MKKIKMLASPVWAMLFIVAQTGIWLFFNVLIIGLLAGVIGVSNQEDIAMKIILIFFLIMMTAISIIVSVLFHKEASIVEVSPKGIKSSFLFIFCRKKIAWSELKSIKCSTIRGNWIVFATTNLAELSDAQAIRQKNIIKIQLNMKVLEIITENTDLLISDLPKEILGAKKI